MMICFRIFLIFTLIAVPLVESQRYRYNGPGSFNQGQGRRVRSHHDANPMSRNRVSVPVPSINRGSATNRPVIGFANETNDSDGSMSTTSPPVKLKSSYNSLEESSSSSGEKSTDYTDESNNNVNKDPNCVCVPYYQCDNGKIVEDGAGLINPRNKPLGPQKEIPLEGRYQPKFCGTYDVCCSDPSTVTQQPYVHRCGNRNPSGINSRILSPDKKFEAEFGEWPWQAAILESEKDHNLFRCGGTVIDNRFIITVAHCVREFVNRPNLLRVRLGEWDTANDNEFLPHEDFNVEQVIIHPEFRQSNLWNDIALLKLDKSVTFGPNIDTVCLPDLEETHDSQNCVTTGWGRNASKSGSFSTILKKLQLKVVPREECQAALRRTRLGHHFILHKSFVCAGGEAGRDACEGDGGGPLVCHRPDGTYSLVGLVAWGIDCGKKGIPGVYTDVSQYLKWIVSKTGKDRSYYSINPRRNF